MRLILRHLAVNRLGPIHGVSAGLGLTTGQSVAAPKEVEEDVPVAGEDPAELLGMPLIREPSGPTAGGVPAAVVEENRGKGAGALWPPDQGVKRETAAVDQDRVGADHGPPHEGGPRKSQHEETERDRGHT